MSLPLLLMVQAIGGGPSERVVIDLTIPSCKPSPDRPDEVLVCGHRNADSPYRIRSQVQAQATLPKAGVELGAGASLSAEAEQGEIGGIPTNRAVVKLKIKF